MDRKTLLATMAATVFATSPAYDSDVIRAVNNAELILREVERREHEKVFGTKPTEALKNAA
jgi:hypothetical protein